MSSIGERIRARRIELKQSQKTISGGLGIDRSTLAKIELGTVDISINRFCDAAALLGVSPASLLEGPEEVSDTASAQSRVPLINWDAVLESGADKEIEAQDWLYYPKQCGSRTFALTVNNDSMVSPHPNSKSYPIGTIIFVDPDFPIKAGSRVIAQVGNAAQVTFKEYREDGGNSYLIPINCQYPTTTVDDDTVLIGTIIGSFMAE